MPTDPVFSVVIPSYNSKDKLAATIQSTLEQDGVDFEVLVMDGSSTDGTLDLLPLRFGGNPRLRVVSQPDQGIYDAMNKGISLARGEYLYFLGAGDHLRPGALRTASAVLKARATAPPAASGDLFLYGDVRWLDSGRIYDGAFSRRKIAVSNICHQAIFYERGIFDRVGLYETRFRNCADHALNIRCFGDPMIEKVYFDCVVADYEGGGASSTRLDIAFSQELLGLVRQNLGRQVWLYAWSVAQLHRLGPANVARAVRRRLRTLASWRSQTR